MLAYKLLSRGPWIGILGLALLPLFFSVGPWVETRLFPVVETARVQNERTVDRGVTFYVRFEKVRSCEFVNLSWYQGSYRRRVEFEPSAANYPETRPVGGQFSGPWLVEGVHTLHDTHAVTHHRCHPLWLTESHFYP